MSSGTQQSALSIVQGKRILRQVAILADRYGLGAEGIKLLEKARDCGFYDDNIMSGIIFCLANNRRSDEAVALFAEVEGRLGGFQRAPSSHIAGIYAVLRDGQQSRAQNMLSDFEANCVPYLDESVRGYYVGFMELIKELM